jgi:hypothetical protein
MKNKFWNSALMAMIIVIFLSVPVVAQDLFLCSIATGEGGRIMLDCAPYQAPTSTPVPTEEPTAIPTEEPTATATIAPPAPTTEPEINKATWHAPGIAHDGCTPHEHGDPVPAWVIAAGYSPRFDHSAMTPAENMPCEKHTAFKQWAGRFSGQDWFGIFHLDFHPGGRVSRFHSYQLWARDATNAVSFITGWLDFGTANNTGPQVIPICGNDTGIRPVMTPSQVGCEVRFESWYARACGNGGWEPDFRSNTNPNYFHGGDPANPATWTPTGGIRNLDRRIEFAWYLGGGGIRPAQRGEFWSTQWGRIVSGPSDPICGTPRTVGERTYTTLCLRQYVAPTLQPMVFPGNAVQRTFPGNGVMLPN